MSKLSRKDRYKDLRESMASPDFDPQSVKPSPRPARAAAPDLREKSKTQQVVFPATSSVMEDLFEEVSAYNHDSLNTHLDDRQIEILHEFTESSASDERRNSHFVTMEQKEDEGGTTRNLFSSDLSAIAQNTTVQPKAAILNRQPSKVSQENLAFLSDLTAAPTMLDQVQLSAHPDRVLEEQREENPSAKKKQASVNKTPLSYGMSEEAEEVSEVSVIEADRKPARSKQKFSRTKSAEDLEEERYFAAEKPARTKRHLQHDSSLDKPAGKAAMIFMIICCIILAIMIGLTIFWMSKLRIF